MAAETADQPCLVIAPEVVALGVPATYLVVDDLQNGQSDPEFESYKADLAEALREEYTPEFVKRDPVLEGYRELRRRIGRSIRKYPCSSESLIGVLGRTGGAPSINLAVDIYNCLCLETRLTLGAHDLDQVTGNINLRLARGDELFRPLGSERVETVGEGEYCYIDDGGQVLCRLDYRQCDRTKVGLGTRRAFFIIQGNPATSAGDLESARARLAELLDTYCRA